MISVQLHRDALDDRIDVVRRLLDATHPAALSGTGPVAREARGLAILLLFAAYENLLYSLTRTLLDAAKGLRVGNRRLRPGFRMFAISGAVASLRTVGDKRLFSSAIPKLLHAAADGRQCTIDVDAFPSDGSYMKSSQVVLWCDVFGLPHPGSLLSNVWSSLDAIVSDRNGIAHGRLTPQDVGRRYTESEIRALVEAWSMDWKSFLDAVESAASTRDFFRLPR
ncbi:hypothetical protein Q9R32_05390 [Actinotalea sp. AC32]|nr:hypothetical protein [Actinotalea sp. AC32]